ncbi:MAG: hypothetical protein ACKPKO_43405, partial [Candidatus Fonsibacter sp.]
VEGDLITLSNGMALPVSLIKKNFVHNYCNTCHSFQGNTIDESITILDHKFAYVSRKWLYTAVNKGDKPQARIFLRLRRECREGARHDTVLY